MTKDQSATAATIPPQKFTESRIGLWLNSADETNPPPNDLTADELAAAKVQLHAWRAAANKQSRAEDLLKELRALIAVYGEPPRTDEDRLAETDMWLTAFFGIDAKAQRIVFSVDQLQRAFAAHIATPKQGDFAPKPSQILAKAFAIKSGDNSRVVILEELLDHPAGPWVFKGRWRTRFAWEASNGYTLDRQGPASADDKARVAGIAEQARKRLGPPAVLESPFGQKHAEPGPFDQTPDSLPIELPAETASGAILDGLREEPEGLPTPDR